MSYQSKGLAEKRPLSISIICVLSGIGALLILCISWLPVAESEITLFEILVLNLISIASLIVSVNLWRMKKWAAYSFVAIQILNIVLSLEQFSLIAVLVQALYISFVLKHVSKMS